MSGQTVSLISTNKRKFSFYDKILRINFPDIRLLNQNFQFKQSTTLDEFEIAKDRVDQALKIFNPPFIIDQEGFYIDGFPAFPGVISRQIIYGMGWPGILKISEPSKMASLFCHVAFVDSSELMHVFREQTTGTLVSCHDQKATDSIYDHFVPMDQKLTLTQLESDGEMANAFPRYKATMAMIKSKPFCQEFSKTKKTVSAISHIV